MIIDGKIMTFFFPKFCLQHHQNQVHIKFSVPSFVGYNSFQIMFACEDLEDYPIW